MNCLKVGIVISGDSLGFLGVENSVKLGDFILELKFELSFLEYQDLGLGGAFTNCISGAALAIPSSVEGYNFRAAAAWVLGVNGKFLDYCFSVFGYYILVARSSNLIFIGRDQPMKSEVSYTDWIKKN